MKNSWPYLEDFDFDGVFWTHYEVGSETIHSRVSSGLSSRCLRPSTLCFLVVRKGSFSLDFA